MKVIYLAAGYGKLKYKNVIYQDKYIKRDIGGDMLDVDLSKYQILLASPPCNYYSKANRVYLTSKYSLDTKHLLPNIINNFSKTFKPFIVENVINKKRMIDIINNFNGFYYEIGRHSYFTNIMFNLSNIKFKPCNIKYLSKKQRQGCGGVNEIFDYFIKYIMECEL